MVVYADFQTEGRGQHNKVWDSEKELNLLMSVIYHVPFLNAKKLFLLNMAFTLAAANTIEHYIGNIANVEIKWPNDILANEKKICGILIETILRNEQIEYAVVGIGVNINQSVFDFQKASTTFEPTSLKSIAHIKIEKENVFNYLCEELEKYYFKLKNQAFEEIKTEYIQKLYGHKNEVYIEIEQNCKPVLVENVEENGTINLTDMKKNKYRFVHGEFQFIKKPDSLK